MNIRSLFILLIFNLLYLSLVGQTPFEFEGQKVAPGTKQHFTVELSGVQHNAQIPITVFHGKTDGSVLGITTGVHGYEYAPILAGQTLIETINPDDLSGTIILVQIANVASFLGRSPYTNPKDGKNLNRVFPGDPNGTITERIADFISQKVISRSDFFVDIHSGDAPEDLMAYSAYYQNDQLPEVSEIGRQMAAHMGYDHVIVFKTTGKNYMQKDQPSLYCSAQAFKQGIPAVDVECGRLGMIEQVFVDKIVIGVTSLLKHLDFLDGSPIPPNAIAYIDNRSSQSSQQTGFFYPQKSSGDYV
ncbi:MAG: M14 family metallopeptidase, partial [Bacteroidota bacterium]